MSVNVKSPNANAAVDTPQTAPLTPEQVVEQLRALMASIPDVPSLTPEERLLLKKKRPLPDHEVLAAIDVVGASGKVSQILGIPAVEAKQLLVDAGDWTPIESEARGLLKAIEDANLVRRQRATLIAIQAYAIGQQLARTADNAAIVPHVEVVKRMKATRRRKKAPASGTPPASDSSKS